MAHKFILASCSPVFSPKLNKRDKTAAVKKSQGIAKNIEVDNKQKKKNAKDIKTENVKPKPVNKNTKIQEKTYFILKLKFSFS